MATKSLSEAKRVRYLLGLSSPTEREEIESEYFYDDNAFQEMLTTEDDLIDAYVRCELEQDQRRRFERIFVSSFEASNRVGFARAFASAVSTTMVTHKDHGPLGGVLKIFQSPFRWQTATIAVATCFVVMLGWVVKDRRRLTNELHELQAQTATLRSRTELLEQSGVTRTPETAAHSSDVRAQPAVLQSRERVTPPTRSARYVREVKNGQERIASAKIERPEKLDKYDATLASTFVNKQITQLPLTAKNVPGLITLQPGPKRNDYLAENRNDQSNISFDGVPIQSLHPYIPIPRNTTSEIVISIPNSLPWIRFQIVLEPAAIRENYRMTITAADGRPVTTVDWIEPLIPNQTAVDTPVVATGDLPSGDYVLLLMVKEADASFAKVAEYSFKVIKQ